MCRKLICLIYFVLVLCLVGTSAAQNIDPSLVGWWTFDDGSGKVAKDLSGNGVDATFFGEPTWGTEAGHGAGFFCERGDFIVCFLRIYFPS